jgi:hypothetical protein
VEYTNTCSIYTLNSYFTACSRKQEKPAIQGKALTGDDDDDDGDDGQVRRGGTAIAVVGTEAGGGQGIKCTMRDEICIAYGVLMTYLVKSLSEVGILLYIRTNDCFV